EPYGRHALGWTNPRVLVELGVGLALLVVFVVLETRVRSPMFRLPPFQLRPAPAVWRHLHAPADARLPDRRAGVRLSLRPLRRTAVRHRWDARCRSQLPAARAAADRLPLPGVRADP